MSDEDQYRKEMSEEGIDIPEADKPQEEPKEAPKGETPKEPEEPKTPEEPEKEPNPEPLQDPPKDKPKRSVYDDLKSERQKRKEVEQQYVDLEQKYKEATTPKEKQDVDDELAAFAEEIGADASTLSRMRAVLLKGVQSSGLSDEDKALLEDLKDWKAQHEPMLEKQRFNEEFSKVTPTIKEMFPNITDEEIASVRDKLDELAHQEDNLDKELDYIAFKNRETLNALLTPKKQGIERKSKSDVDEIPFTFDPNADISKMTAEQAEQWQKEYDKLTSGGEGLSDDGRGGKVLL